MLLFKIFIFIFFAIVFYVIGFLAGSASALKNTEVPEVKPKTKKQKQILAYTGETELEIDYHDSEGNITNRNISVKYLYKDNGYTYIRAFCHLRNELRTFRIDNIIKMYIDKAEIPEPIMYFNDKIDY